MSVGIAEVENAILARLRSYADAGVLGYAWGTLESYPVDWDEYFREKTQWKAPAAWVSFLGWGRATQLSTGVTRAAASFGLVVAADNKRNETATRHGGIDGLGAAIAAEPGSYQLLLDAVAVLGHATLGLDIDPLIVGQARGVRKPAALKDRNCSMFAVQLDTFIEVPWLADPADPAMGDFETFHANWDVPAFGNVDADPLTAGVQIPADASADATDHVAVPQ